MVRPSIHEVAFGCPHCGAYASQTWFRLYAEQLVKDAKVPELATHKWLEVVHSDKSLTGEMKERFLAFVQKGLSGLVFLDRRSSSTYANTDVHNLHLSQCFVCNEVAIWVHENLVFPTSMEADLPNEDLPEDAIIDYQEASRIVSLSPRGAAALLRLAIQKLCASLGEKGKNIDDDIANLVKKGLLLLFSSPSTLCELSETKLCILESWT